MYVKCIEKGLTHQTDNKAYYRQMGERPRRRDVS